MASGWPVTGADVAKTLKWPADRANEVTDHADAAVARIEKKVGPWHGQTLTHAVTARTARTAIVLPWPVATVDEVTLDGQAVEPDAIDPEAGIVYAHLAPGRIVVTATARDPESVPADIVLAGRKLGAHLAKQDLVGPRQPGQSGSSEKDVDVLQGFALPRAVSELIADYVLPGGFA